MIRTLIVDDDFRVADVHRGFVNRLDGFVVVGEVHTGADALAAVERLRPDLVVLDLYLPDLHGLDVLRRIQAISAPRPDVVVVTAARDVESLRSAMQGGVVHYLVKPFSFRAFEEKLQSYAQVRTRLASVGVADQQEVDRAFARLYGAVGGVDLPKGVSAETMRLVVDVLQTCDEDLNALDVARRAGVSRVTARRYLELLAQEGRVEVILRYGAPGRPEHRYHLLGPGPANLP
jgi:response regulator of citrate/malate metabolism